MSYVLYELLDWVNKVIAQIGSNPTESGEEDEDDFMKIPEYFSSTYLAILFDYFSEVSRLKFTQRSVNVLLHFSSIIR